MFLQSQRHTDEHCEATKRVRGNERCTDQYDSLYNSDFHLTDIGHTDCRSPIGADHLYHCVTHLESHHRCWTPSSPIHLLARPRSRLHSFVCSAITSVARRCSIRTRGLNLFISSLSSLLLRALSKIHSFEF